MTLPQSLQGTRQNQVAHETNRGASFVSVTIIQDQTLTKAPIRVIGSDILVLINLPPRSI